MFSSATRYGACSAAGVTARSQAQQVAFAVVNNQQDRAVGGLGHVAKARDGTGALEEELAETTRKSAVFDWF
jgi:hypothetical protein